MTPFDQQAATSRCEWGVAAVDALAPAQVIIVIDVLTFTTCVDVATARGVVILPYAWRDDSAAAFAAAQGAVVAQKRDAGTYSLSPASFLDAPRGLRCVLPSPNGAAVALHAAHTGSVVLAACLRNASAVAAAAQRLGSTFNVCPAGERWPDGSLRPAVEDWLGAGAVLAQLPGPHSPEAKAAIAAFADQRRVLAQAVTASASGRELVERGFAVDPELAVQYDVSSCVPRLWEGGFAAEP